jgi:imidazolonepropionase-like amidohydrolase
MANRWKWFAAVACVLLLPGLAGLRAQAMPAADVKVIHAGHLFDAKAGRMLDNQDILIRGDKIVQVGANIAVPAGAEEIDLRKATVLPGFIDCHVHLTSARGGLGIVSAPRAALYGAANARLTLLAGFTSVRNVGADGYADMALRDAINDGDVIGPRMQASGPIISITGGHGDISTFPFDWHISGEGVADGVPGVMAKVREEIKYGADVIKFAASGGVFSKGDNPQNEAFSPEEMQALIAEAHREGRKVATHAHATIAIKDAVRAGVDSIEHGIFLDEEGIQLMKQHGTYLVPTSYALYWFADNVKSLNMPPYVVEKAAVIIPAAKVSMAKAFREGVKVALGTDAGVLPHGMNGGEFWAMVELGMTPVQALQAGTVNAADLMGWSDKIGAIEAGHFADIVAVSGDPLTDIKQLQHVKFVMKGGTVHKNEF